MRGGPGVIFIFASLVLDRTPIVAARSESGPGARSVQSLADAGRSEVQVVDTQVVEDRQLVNAGHASGDDRRVAGTAAHRKQCATPLPQVAPSFPKVIDTASALQRLVPVEEVRRIGKLVHRANHPLD